MPSSEYNVNITITTKDKTSAAAGKAEKSLLTLANAAKMVAMAYAALRTAQKALAFVKLGAQAQAAEHSFNAFAGGVEQATKYLDAFDRGTDGVIPRMEAMTAATKMLSMGLVTNAAEMELMVAIAVKLGNKTLDAGQRLMDFALLLGNQATRRLDNFGLSVGATQKRIEELQAASVNMTREEAFKIAVMELGTVALAKLGDTSGLTATKIGQLEKAFKDAKVELAIFVADAALAGIEVDKLAQIIHTVPEALLVWIKIGTILHEVQQGNIKGASEMAAALQDSAYRAVNALEGLQYVEGAGWLRPEIVQAMHDRGAALNEYIAEIDRQVNAYDGLAEKAGLITATEEELAAAQKLVDENQRVAEATFEQRIWLLEREGQQARDAALAAQNHAQALQAEMAAAYNASLALMDLAASYSSYLGQVAMSGADYAGSMAEIEAQYQKTIEGITAGGGGAGGGAAAAAREFDKADIERGLKIKELQLKELEAERAGWEAERETTEPVFWYELARADRKWLMDHGKTLEDLALKREETVDEVTELERAQMDDRVEDLKNEIAETARILKQGHWDQSQIRIGAAQRDTAALLAEAQTRRDAQIAALEKSQAREEEMNRQSLGRIKLAAFDHWLSMQEDTDKWTKAQWDAVEKMRLNIMTEYGLLTPALLAETIKWQQGFDSMFLAATTGAKAAVSEIQRVIDKLLEIPAEKRIKIITEIIKEERPGITVPEITRQHGGPVKAGMPYIVGEPNGELFVPQTSGYIIPHVETQRIINSNNQQTYNFPDARAMAYLGMQERVRARQGFAVASGM